MLVAGTPGLAAVTAAGGETAVVGRAAFGLAAPGGTEVLRGSSWAVVGRGVREALLVSEVPA